MEKQTDKRIYQVTGPAGVRMIRASSQAQAKGFYVGTTVRAEVATQEDLVGFLSEPVVEGVLARKVETAGEQLELQAG